MLPGHLRWPLISIVLLAACFNRTAIDDSTTTDTSTTDTVTGDGDPTTGDGDPTTGDGDPTTGDGDPTPGDSANVDVLIVIDNSGSMGEEQAKLATSISTLVTALEAANADYRIAVTTTDNGNTWCPAGTTTPEAGQFVMSSCRDRIGDFIFNNGETDATDIACNDLCALDSAELVVQPTSTDLDPNPAPRPWLEKIGGQTNLPPSTDVVEALRCFLPQGINGCGFESQLESMYLGLARAQDAAENNYGFLRPDSVLAVLLVSDEADCSSNKTYSEIFEQDGNRVFWSDPNASFPTSAVCWNAGVTCIGDPNNYASCDSVNKDVNGNEGVADSDAVLQPMSRYRDLLQGIEDSVQDLQPGRQVVVGLIGGLAPNGTVRYADVSQTDPAFQDAFGIGPGCVGPNPNDPSQPQTAVPPVRMYELVEEFSAGNSHSICADGYSPALMAFADRITAQLP